MLYHETASPFARCDFAAGICQVEASVDPMSKRESYLRQAEECIALAKVATSNKLRANHYATADRYLRLAEAEPTMTNSDALSDHGQIPVALSATT
jgi:hypothetical protein